MTTSSKCKNGFIKRKSYTRKGTHVKSKCIRSTSKSGVKRSSIDKKKIKKEEKEHKIAREKFGTPDCKNKEIIKEGYYRNSYRKKTGSKVKGKWIEPTCVKSRVGSSSKGKKLFVLEKGELGQYGYDDIKHISKMDRHKSLKKALKDIPALSIMRKLNALATLNKNQDIDAHNIFIEDRDWIKTTKEYIERN